MRRECVHYIGLLMFEEDKTKRYKQEKIALAVILAISLLVARLVVELKGVIRMTAPVELSRSGLSVSMPQGNGWRCDGKWAYGDGFTINSVFAVRAGQIQSYARCHYILASKQQTIQGRFSEDAEAMSGKVVEMGQMDTGPSASPRGEQGGAGKLVVDWARISGDDGLEMLTGICGLADGRELEIDVLQTGAELGLTQNIFERIVKGIQFNDNGLLQAGVQVVSEARDTGLSAGAGDDNQPVFFILYDSKGQAIGFTMDSMEVRDEDEPAVKAASYFYRRGLAANEEAGFYRGDVAFRQFDWGVVGSSPRTGRKGIEMSADTGVLTVRKLGAGGREKEYALSESAVPDIALEPVLQRMLDSAPREMIIDLIRSDGVITPVYIEMVNQSDGNSIKLEVLDGRGYRQQICYDDTKQPIKIVVEQEDKYMLNRATAEEIAKTFPERAELVLKQDQPFDREGI